MTQVTMQEWNVLTFIRTFWQQYGYSASVVEVTDALCIRNRHVTYRLLKKMEKRGLLCLGGQANRRGYVVLCKVAVAVQP